MQMKHELYLQNKVSDIRTQMYEDECYTNMQKLVRIVK